jgi:hypothetical protein
MASNIRINGRILTDSYRRKVERQAKLGLQDITDDLVRTSSQNAPHDEGILEKSWSKEINDLTANVSYTVKKKGGKDKKHGNFNYALKMHEETYNLGEGSRSKSGGTGMSGKTYSVGTGYLMNVVEGEEEVYRKHIEKMIKDV